MKTATATGKSLITIALSLMLLLSLFAGSASAENMPRSISSDLPEYKTVHVSTADEFLAAIGNNTQIVIDADLIDFSTASDYGKTSGSFYGWEEQFDGPELVIMDVKNLQIIGQGQDKTLIQATPRYADVISFRNCEDLVVSGLTAGHLKEAPGSCIGGVLNFEKCAQVNVENCGLFGCGIIGILARDCANMAVNYTEIYECSIMGAQLINCENTSFSYCSIHDCESNSVFVDGKNNNIFWDGKVLENGDTIV